MSPRLNINDIVIVKKGYEIESYKKGNIITFIRDNEVITHRIEKVISADMRPAFVTKGDNNKVEDIDIVKYEDIIGKVVLTMPKLGAFVKLLKNKFFFTFILCVLLGIMHFDNKTKQRREERKLVREKYEKKSDFYF
jgi:signal peptidase